jgi:hypothetical protein
MRVLWALTKPGSLATCELWLHPRGWQVRLTLNGREIAISMCPEHELVHDVAARWRDNLYTADWRDIAH